jgi:hypothetical protein
MAYIIHFYCEPLRPFIEALSIGGFGAYTSIIFKRIMFKI